MSYCPPGRKTDNPQGECCALPFVYGGVTYHSCTKVGHSREWCSLTTVYIGKWANCGKEIHMILNLYSITNSHDSLSAFIQVQSSCIHLFHTARERFISLERHAR